jgi:type VI secretion system secreted protein VgrG
MLGLAQSLAVPGASKATNTGRPKLNGGLGVSSSPKMSSLFGTATHEDSGKSATGTTHETDAVGAHAQDDAVIAPHILSGAWFTSDLTGQGKVVTGTIHGSDAVWVQPLNNVLATPPSSLPFTRHPTGRELRSLTVAPDVRPFASSPQLTGIPAQDAQGRPSADFVQVKKNGISTSSSTVSRGNGDADDGVDWDDGSSAGPDATTPFAANILADESTALDAGAEILCGRAIPQNAAVTTHSNIVSTDCTDARTDRESGGLGDFASLGFSSNANGDGQGRDLPEPSSCLLLLATGLISVGARMKGTFRASRESA